MTASVTIDVNDAPPTANCQDVTVQLDENGEASVILADINNGSNDACGIASLALDITSFDCSNTGANTVTLTVTDNNENSAACTALLLPWLIMSLLFLFARTLLLNWMIQVLQQLMQRTSTTVQRCMRNCFSCTGHNPF